MTTLHTPLRPRRVALALLLAAAASTAACGVSSLTSAPACDPRDPRGEEWTRELAEAGAVGMLPPCQSGGR